MTTTLKNRDANRFQNPWLRSFAVTISTDSGLSVHAPDSLSYSLASEAAAQLVALLECRNDTGLVVTVEEQAV
jgi:hypothetical protein